MVTLHLGLRQKIVCDKVLEPTVFRSGASEELAEGAIEAALKAVFCGVVSALRIVMLIIPILGAIAILGCAIATIVVSILKLVYLYRTAKIFREYPVGV